MGCVHTKRKRIFEDPSMLSSQTRCSHHMLSFKEKIISNLYGFTVREVKQLHELFRKLGSTITDDGFINREEFKLGLFGDSKKRSYFADRMFDMFDTKRDGVLDFGELVRSLSIFHPETPQLEKITFLFRLYDIHHTGFIEREEVKEMITELLSESDLALPDEIIEAIIDKTFEEADSRKDGKIDMEEWTKFADKKPSVLRNMTIPQLRDMSTFPSFSVRSEREEITA